MKKNSEDGTSPGVSFSQLIPTPKKSMINITRDRRTPINSCSILLKRSLFPHSKLKVSGKCGKNENRELQNKKSATFKSKIMKNIESKNLGEKMSAAMPELIQLYSLLGRNSKTR